MYIEVIIQQKNAKFNLKVFAKASYLYTQKGLERKINKEKLVLSQGRKLFITEILKIDDYNELKKENQISTQNLKKQANDYS